MPQVAHRISNRARRALQALARYEVLHKLPYRTAIELAANEARLTPWYLRYTLLRMPQGKDVYEREVERLHTAQEADHAA